MVYSFKIEYTHIYFRRTLLLIFMIETDNFYAPHNSYQGRNDEKEIRFIYRKLQSLRRLNS